MKKLFHLATALACVLLFSGTAVYAAAPSGTLPQGFVAATATANNVQIHYVRGGAGPAVVLIHGWPQSWYEWRALMPRLARDYTVIALDLRGVGGSSAPPSGYDKATLAEDVHGLVTALGIGRFNLIGHDIGGMVAYAYLRLYPENLLRVALLEAPIPGVGPWAQLKTNPNVWQFGFHQQPLIPEALVQGRQATYLRLFMDSKAWRKDALTDADIAVFAAAYGDASRLKAGFDFYRTFAADEAFAASHTVPVNVPVLVAGGDRSAGPFVPAFAQGLRVLGLGNVTTAVIAESGHWVAEEQPQSTGDILADFLKTVPAP